MTTSDTRLQARSPLPDALNGASVLLVGGTSGIVQAAARLLLSVGARPSLVSRDPDRLARAAADLQPAGDGGPVPTIVADATDRPRSTRPSTASTTTPSITCSSPSAASPRVP